MPEIIKRNGKRERFEAYKVQQAIEKAFHASQEEYNPLVYANVLDKLKHEEYLPVEMVQDRIEKELMRAGAYDTARNFIKYRFLHKLQREQIAGLYQGNTWVDCKQTIEEYIGNTIEKIAGINHRDGIEQYVGRVNCALVPEPDNEYDSDAIKIVADDRHHLGYIQSEQTDFVRSMTANEFPSRCTAFIDAHEDEDDGHKFFTGFVYIKRLD